MKLIIVLTIIALFVLVGCSKEPAVVTDVVEDSVPNVQDSVADSVLDSVSEEEVMGVDNIEKIGGAMAISEKARVFPSSKKLDKGDEYQFALGFGNPLNKPKNLQVHIAFKGAVGSLSNELIVNESEVQKWVPNLIDDVIVHPGIVTAIPLNVVIPENDVKRGSYKFTVKAYETDSISRGINGWDLYGEYEFSVFVS